MSVIVKGTEMPDCCGLCYCFHPEHPMYCQAVKVDITKKISAPYGKPRPDWCPLVEIPSGAMLIDAKQLKKKVLKWMPPDPCGVEEKEFPFETDICVSMIMEIDEAPTVLEAELEE